MKSILKKIIAFTIMTTFVISSCAVVYADDTISPPMKGPKYEYKTEYGAQFSHIFVGEPSGQEEDGVCIAGADRGWIYFSKSGGPTVTTSVSVGGKFGNISISTNLGKQSNSGVAVEIKPGYFWKVRVYKTVIYKPYITYRRVKGSSEWTVYTKGAVNVREQDPIFEAYKVKPCEIPD